jgi:3-dehydroquinate dehydratase-2
MRILVVNGPNLNLLGTREPEVYGAVTLNDITARLVEAGRSLNVEVESFQSNHEGQLIDRVQAAAGKADAVILNPGAYTHTSVALRDALLGVKLPFVEVHLSNVFKREPFRHHSYFSDIALGVISGLGSDGYEAALRFLAGRPKA